MKTTVFNGGELNKEGMMMDIDIFLRSLIFVLTGIQEAT
jgi:hypothetical protein